MIAKPLIKIFSTRRAALKGLASLGLGVGLVAACGPQGGSGLATEADYVLGSDDAPVTIIEYASTTCPHCAAFHAQVLPELKTRYIDTGQAKLVFRELPTAPQSLAAAGMLMARCAGRDRYFDVIDTLFDRQIPLLEAYNQPGGVVLDELTRIARAAGLSEEEFNACIRDEEALENLRAIGEEARDVYGVTGTPAFIINGELMNEAPTIEAFEARIEPLLAES